MNIISTNGILPFYNSLAEQVYNLPAQYLNYKTGVIESAVNQLPTFDFVAARDLTETAVYALVCKSTGESDIITDEIVITDNYEGTYSRFQYVGDSILTADLESGYYYLTFTDSLGIVYSELFYIVAGFSVPTPEFLMLSDTEYLEMSTNIAILL